MKCLANLIVLLDKLWSLQTPEKLEHLQLLQNLD